MPKYTGIVDHYADGQITKLFHRLHDGDWAYETIQDCESIFDANKEAQQHCSTWSADRSMRLDARIPLIFRQKWMDIYGVDFLDNDPDVQDRVDRILDSSEWRWMRTNTATLGKYRVSKAEIDRRLTARRMFVDIKDDATSGKNCVATEGGRA